MLTTVKKDYWVRANEYGGESESEFKTREKNERKQSWKEKMLHWPSLRQTDEEAGKERWLWLRSTGIKIERESLIMAAQEQAICTNVIKAKIDKTQEESKCRMCGRVDETVNHVLSECSKMAETEYKRRHDWVGKRIHWDFCYWDVCDHTLCQDIEKSPCWHRITGTSYHC